MKRLTGILVAALMLGGAAGGSHAKVRIANDRGGRIGDYVDKYKRLRDAGEFVVIDGYCIAACTIVLAAVPHDRICLTSNAKFGVQAAWDADAGGKLTINDEATRLLYLAYPSEIRRWIDQHGGMTLHVLWLPADRLRALYRSCSAGD